MKKEYDSLQDNGTWILVEKPKDKKVLTNRWVFKTKTNQNGEIEKYKARLVARGHTQRHGIDYEEVFAPVARYEIIRTMMAIAANEEMYVHQMDVVSAYVQGELHDEVYMKQPEMFVKRGEEMKVCKLLRPLYGLKQSGHEWYKKFDNYLRKIGCSRTIADPCIYVFGDTEDKVILIIYVDDFLFISKNLKELECVKSKITSEFKVIDLGQISSILGISVRRDSPTGSVHLSQRKYTEELIKKFGMKDAKSVATPIESNVKLTLGMGPTTKDEEREMKTCPYREIIGGLIYLANTTRPDIAFAASTLSRFCSNPGKSHWMAAKRVLRYLKATLGYGIAYRGDQENLRGFTDIYDFLFLFDK